MDRSTHYNADSTGQFPQNRRQQSAKEFSRRLQKIKFNLAPDNRQRGVGQDIPMDVTCSSTVFFLEATVSALIDPGTGKSCSCTCVSLLLHFASVVDDAKCIVVTRVCVSVRMCVCLSVCLSAAVRPHYCTDPDVAWGRGRGCPLVVHYWADLQSGHGLRCYGNITRTLVTSLRPSRDMTT